MARYWMGPWVWGATAGLPSWVTPPGVAAAVDLRSAPQSVAAGGAPQGVGLFVTGNLADLGSSYTDFGTDPTAVLSGAQKSAWQTLCGLPNALSSNTLQLALYETLTAQSDPTGQANAFPLDATTGRRYELWLAGQLVRSVAFDVAGVEAGPLRQRLQATYRALRQRCLDGLDPPQQYLKALGYWARKYGVAYRWFQPPDLPDEPDLPPDTTLADDFNRADQAGLGTASGGFSWAAVTGNLDVVSNAAQRTGNSTGLGICRAESDLSGADHYAQVSVTALPFNSQQYGPCARFDPSAATFYVTFVYTGDGNQYLQKYVSGTGTTLANAAVTTSLPEPYKCEANGSSIKGYQAGVQRVSATDTAIAGNLRCGAYAYQGNNGAGPSGDDWSAADLAVGPGFPPPFPRDPYPMAFRTDHYDTG